MQIAVYPAPCCISSLQKLLQIDSVLDESTISVGAPFGEGIKNALEAFLEMAKKDGFKTVNFRGEPRVIRNGQDLYKYYLVL